MSLKVSKLPEIKAFTHNAVKFAIMRSARGADALNVTEQ